MSDSVTYKGYEIYADGFGKDGGDRWQPTLAIARPEGASNEPAREKQFWVKYPKQFYPTRAAAAAVALMAGKAIVDGKFPGQTLGDL